MKKLIAIAVVFALVAAGSVFAVDLGGAVIGTVDVAGADAGGDPALFNNGGTGRVRLEGSGEADIGIGTVGGWLRFDVKGGTNLGVETGGEIDINGNGKTDKGEDFSFASSGIAAGLAWWQPISVLRLQIGVNPDGHYDASHITRYGFYAQANEINSLVTADGNWGPISSDTAIFGGYGDLHFGLIITPIEALSINVAIPLNKGPEGDDKQPAVAFKSALFQANYAADFGAIHVTYAGGGSGNTIGTIYGSAFLGMIENLGLEFGVGFTAKKADTGKAPVGIGLGATYDVGAFGIKLRTFLSIPLEDEEDFGVRVDVLPSFAVNDNVTIFGDLGILFAAEDNFIWHVAPYVRIGSTWGPGFYAGFRMSNGAPYSITKAASGVNWAIPIGIIIGF